MNSKTNYRCNHARRQKERRSNPFEFNSPDWIALMMKQFVLWPKQDRRNSDRRSSDRRARNGEPLADMPIHPDIYVILNPPCQSTF